MVFKMHNFISFIFYSIIITFLLSIPTEIYGYKMASDILNIYNVLAFVTLGFFAIMGELIHQCITYLQN